MTGKLKAALIIASTAGLVILLIGVFTFAFIPREKPQLYFLYNLPAQDARPSKSSNTPIGSALIRVIENAKESLDIAVYGFRDQPEILDALLDAKRRGVVIRLVTDRNQDGTAYYTSTLDYEKQIGSAVNDWRGATSEAAKKANELSPFEDIMHNKFVVADQQTVWTGSCNVSDTCSGGYNANTALLIKSKVIAEIYSHEFEQMYMHRRFHEHKFPHSEELISKLEDSPILYIGFSPTHDVIKRRIIPLIDSANQSIKVAMFYLTHKDVAKALIAAHNRGVDVRVITCASAARNEFSKHNHLRREGVSVKVENWGGKMHSKSALIDDETLICGSMNWTKNGTEMNGENTVILKSPALAGAFTEYFEKAWNSIPDHFLQCDPDPESLASRGSSSDGIDNDYDGYTDAEDFRAYEFVGYTKEDPSKPFTR